MPKHVFKKLSRELKIFVKYCYCHEVMAMLYIIYNSNSNGNDLSSNINNKSQVQVSSFIIFTLFTEQIQLNIT